MEEKIIEMAATQGLWALLSIALMFYIIKAQEKREKNYQNIISSLTDKLNLVEDIKKNVEQIKNSLKK